MFSKGRDIIVNGYGKSRLPSGFFGGKMGEREETRMANVFDGLKIAGKVLQEAGKIEQYTQILEAQEKLLEQQKRISDLESENRDLKEKLELKGKMKFERNAYWIVEEGKEDDGPFCSCCYDDGKRAIRMQPCVNPAFYDCKKCDNKGALIYGEKDVSRFKPLGYRPVNCG